VLYVIIRIIRAVRAGESNLGWVNITLEAIGLCLVAVLGCLAVRRWLPQGAAYDLEPELSITRKNGWALLDLILQNHSDTPIWAEEATFAMADLDADFQGAAASSEGTLRIRETVRPGGALRISLIETVYNAAGKPQGEYSFLISGVIRYQANDTWFEITLQTYRVRMIALSAIRLLQMRWYDQPAAVPGARSRLRRISGGDQGREQRL
jgi:hypothetical protein